MSATIKVIVIEDKVEDRREVMNYLTELCDGEDVIGIPGTYEDAKALLELKSKEVDLVLLDLNLPRDEHDARPEKGHGKRLLDQIHEINRRDNGQIRVIVVSGEEIAEGWDADLLKERYPNTLVGIVKKSDLGRMLKANLKRFRRDPFRDRIRHLGVDVLDQYDTVFDPTKPIRERLKDARSLAIRLVRNDVDYSAKRIGASDPFSDDLNGLIKQLEGRFAPNRNGRQHIDASLIQTAGGWGAFLWRGTFVQHLYTLNSYRNDYEHVDEKPFRRDGTTPNEWEIPNDVLVSVERGERLGKVVELIVLEVLEWYLPWHEQVFAPWYSRRAGSGGEPS